MNTWIKQGLLSALVISLTACGGGSSSSSSLSSQSSSADAAVSASTSSSEPSSSSSSETSSALSSDASSSTSSSVSSSTSSAATSSSSSSDASSSTALSTTYTVRIQAPNLATASSKLSLKPSVSQKTDASASLTADNFAVVIVDLAGNIVETIPLDKTSVIQMADGRWRIKVPGQPRLDQVIITDINKPVVLPSTGSLFAEDVLLAPTTDGDLQLDIASTATYENLLDELGGTGTFDSLSLDTRDTDQLAALKNLIHTVKEQIDSEVFTGYGSITEALAAVQTSVSDIVKVESDNIKAATEGAMADILANEGGINWYEGLELSRIFHGVITRNAEEVQYRYMHGSFQVYFDPAEPHDMLLTPNGWQVENDKMAVLASNADGSVTLNESVSTHYAYTLQASQVFDLAGRNIYNYFKANSNTMALAAVLDQNASFAAGAKGYRTAPKAADDHYLLWYNPGDNTGKCPWGNNEHASDYGGNCEVLSANTYIDNNRDNDFIPAFTQWSDIYSSDTAPQTAGFKALQISWFGNSHISVQLLDDANKTARYFLVDDDDYTLLTEGVWAQITLPDLSTDSAAITLSVPASVVAEGDFDRPSPIIVFAKHNGFLRMGGLDLAGRQVDSTTVLYNDSAANSIKAAVTTASAANASSYVGSWISADASTILTFMNASEYGLSIADNTCGKGLERGFYGFIGNSFKTEASTSQAGDCGFDAITGESNLTVSGDSLVFSANGQSDTFTRVTNSAALGTWIGGDSDNYILTLLSDGHFMFSEDGDAEDAGYPGVEYGTYTYSATTHAFVPSVELNLNGDWGFSDPVGAASYNIVLNGDTMEFSFSDDEDSGTFTFKRVE